MNGRFKNGVCPGNGRCRTLGLVFACYVVMLLATGCVVIPMGTEQFTHSDTIVKTAPRASRIEVLSTTPQCIQRDNTAIVQIGAEVQEEYEQSRHQETVKVHKQKKLAVGFFPGFASIAINPSDGFLAPEMELNPRDTRNIYQARQRWLSAELLMPLSFGILNGLTTICSLGCGPVSEYETFPVTQEWAGAYWARLQRFPRHEQVKMGMFGASTETARAVKRGSSLGLFGVHKYFRLQVDPLQCSDSVPDKPTIQRKSVAVAGPYVVSVH